LTAGRVVFAPPDLHTSIHSGSVEGRAETYLTAMIPLRLTLALRGGGTKVLGDFPYFDAAFLGGPSVPGRLAHGSRRGPVGGAPRSG
jgi:hypothetical protein